MDNVKSIHINGRNVSYLDSGNGKPLVLIHSWPTCCKIFLQSYPYLNKQFRVIAPDLPGFGMSDELSTTHNYESLSNWLAHFLKALNLNHVYLLGVSYGAAVALEFTKRYPSKVSILLLNSPELCYYNQLNWFRKVFYFLVDKSPLLKRIIFNYLIDESDWVFQIIWGHRLQNGEFVNSIKSYGKNLKFRAADETLHEFIYTDSRKTLTTLKGKTFVFTGSKEHPDYLKEISDLSKRNPHVHYECIKEVGHSVVVENPVTFTTHIIHALNN